MKKDILIFGVLNCLVFIAFALAFKYLNLLHIWGLSMINYVALTLMSMLQVHRWIKKGNGYVPFLHVFCTILFTGACAFILFGAFIFVYSGFDTYLAKLFITHTNNTGRLIAPILLFFEGSGGSIIVALITAFYAGRYEDGEVSV